MIHKPRYFHLSIIQDGLYITLLYCISDMNMRKTEVERIGFVTDLPDTNRWGWAIDSDVELVKSSLMAEGFSADDVAEFGCFLVVTETGDYTEIYGVKESIPFNWYDAYRFKVDGRFL